ncbi:Uncharacterised protein [Prevotella intermedia]|nr:Uncharacterised protein [Prevotella intermedia]
MDSGVLENKLVVFTNAKILILKLITTPSIHLRK